MAVYRRLFKQGNSTVITIPAFVLQMMNLERGDFFQMTVLSDKILSLEAKKEHEIPNPVLDPPEKI